MFIKINILYNAADTVSEVITSTLTDAFSLINVLDESSKVTAWNLEDYKPEHFGWLKGENWNKYKTVFFENEKTK